MVEEVAAVAEGEKDPNNHSGEAYSAWEDITVAGAQEGSRETGDWEDVGSEEQVTEDMGMFDEELGDVGGGKAVGCWGSISKERVLWVEWHWVWRDTVASV